MSDFGYQRHTMETARNENRKLINANANCSIFVLTKIFEDSLSIVNQTNQCWVGYIVEVGLFFNYLYKLILIHRQQSIEIDMENPKPQDFGDYFAIFRTGTARKRESKYSPSDVSLHKNY